MCNLKTEIHKIYNNVNILWNIDPLLSNDHETNNEKRAIAMEELRNYATELKPLLGCGPCATVKVLLEAVFSVDYSKAVPLDQPRSVGAVQWSGVGCSVIE
jgi:hypothetical protein